MPRVQVAETTPKKETTGEKRKRLAREAALAGSGSPARRGEDDELTIAAEIATASPAEEPQVPRPAEPAVIEGVVHAREPDDPFQYVPAPEDASDLVHLAHAERQIRKVGEAAGDGFADIEKNYWVLTGRWLSEVQEKGSYKAGGFRSVEAFAASLGFKRHTYYRAIRHHVVYSALGDRVKRPLAQLVIEQLYSLGKDDPDLLRTKYDELAKNGEVTVSAVKNLRRLMAATEQAEKQPKALDGRQPRPVIERAQEARTAGRIDLDLLKELVEIDRQSAQEYVEDMKKKVAEAESLLTG